jgi:hypothetical protein
MFTILYPALEANTTPESLFISSRKYLNDCDGQQTLHHSKRLNEIIGSNYSEDEIGTILHAAVEENNKKKLRTLGGVQNSLNG